MKKQLCILKIFLLFMCLSKNTNSQNLYDSCSFESPVSKVRIDTTGGNTWQIGKPSKNFLSSAHTGNKAIVSDTTQTYKVNDTSSFIYVIRKPYTLTCITTMEFWHKYDMDSLTDYGIIEASYDGGNSWVMVKDTFNSSNTWLSYSWSGDYHASTGYSNPHQILITGKSDGWIQSRFNWQWFGAFKTDTIMIPDDSLMIKFTFISDSIDNQKEGWMIDDILVVSGGWEMCSGIEENWINTLSIAPNPFSHETTLSSEHNLINASLIIYNSLGMKVRELENLNGQSLTLFRENLATGLYFLVMTEKNKVLLEKKLVISE